MPYRLFQSLKEAGSHLKVKILELTESSYKEEKEVPINDLEDWSVVRNLAALGRA
jgi:hypothetical protein